MKMYDEVKRRMMLEDFVKFVEEKNHGMMFVDEYLKRMVGEYMEKLHERFTVGGKQ